MTLLSNPLFCAWTNCLAHVVQVCPMVFYAEGCMGMKMKTQIVTHRGVIYKMLAPRPNLGARVQQIKVVKWMKT